MLNLLVHMSGGMICAVAVPMHDDEFPVDESTVRALISEQMPHLADEALSVVEPWGTANAIWRLGEDLVVRLPRIEAAAGQVELERAWLPRLAPHLSVPLPTPIALGRPGCGYPWNWAVHRWLPGEPAALPAMDDPGEFAKAMAGFVAHLRSVPTDGAPPARNRARPLDAYDAATRSAIAACAHLIDADAATAVWERALAAAPHDGPPVWVHGDLEGNCLLLDGRLGGVVDWGSACAGDPAVDVQVIWSPLFDDESRGIFVEQLEVDEDALARSKGAAVHQACSALPYYLDTYPLIVDRSWHKLAALGIPRTAG